ncbi:hypothetical protein FNJ87_13340 [Nonlabens mediterrranea]|uniref:Uncharacterized protein n=1 Tax=Nonlabens mediterrranea TaxID=1419947 RepID=A0ABS0A9M4_9FLAO|nr:hypothetical protein [Nonlabens mediterrranea]
MKKVLVGIFVFCLLALSCSEEDDIVNNEVSLGVLKTMEIARIAQESVVVNEFTVNIGDENVIVKKVSPTELTFLVPEDLEEGNYSFKIPSQNNLKVSFTVDHTVLTNSPDQIISEYRQALTSLATSEQGVTGINSLDSYNIAFENYYNGLTDNEKIQAATFYEANKSLINDIINLEEFVLKTRPDYSNLTNSTIQKRFGLFTVASGLLVVAAVDSFAINPVVSAVALGVSIAGFVKAHDYLQELSNRSLVTIDLAFGQIESSFEKGALMDRLNLADDVTTTLPFQIGTRHFISSDQSDAGLSETFGFIESIQEMISNLNIVIDGVNNVLFFSNIPNVDNYNVRTNASETRNDITQEKFNNFTFELDTDVASIVQLSFQSGQVAIKVKLNDPSSISGDFLETNLTYTYTDSFNEATGSIPIKINKTGTTNPLLQVGIEGQWRIDIISQTCSNQDLSDDFDGMVLTFSSNQTDSTFGDAVFPSSFLVGSEMIEQQINTPGYNTGNSFDSDFAVNITSSTDTSQQTSPPFYSRQIILSTLSIGNATTNLTTANFDFNTNSIELNALFYRSKIEQFNTLNRDCEALIKLTKL